jgi:2-polyprenyl-3-methyl-5-hydroxy-6-metoxy-1,4-benzoquinol methylase
MMTWEETIKHIRTLPQYADLIRLSYLEEDLALNIDRFLRSEEWHETQGVLKPYLRDSSVILDVGCGNGISSIAFAFDGHKVTATDPDPSHTVGIGAVNTLKEKYSLTNLTVVQGFAENIQLDLNSFDLIYCRQAMHHAADLPLFIKNLVSLLKPGGYLFTVRDHVVWNVTDKKWFLKTHPLHRFYGGENAFTPQEYKDAFSNAGLRLIKEIKHYESPINYFPVSSETVTARKNAPADIQRKFISKFGFFGKFQFLYWLYTRIKFDPSDLLNENKVPGRMYSYLSCRT